MNASRMQKLIYVRDMLRELTDMAKAERYQVLSYLCEMAYMEAGDAVRTVHAENKADIEALPPRAYRAGR
jgi:hypothetical protein